MSRFISKKRALLTAAIASLALVAVAIAFYTTTGSGSGTGTARNGYANALAITGDAPAGLVPGGFVTITGNVHNGNSGAAKVGTVTGAVDAAGSCTDSWFTITDVAFSGGSDVIPANGDRAFTAKLNMADAVDNEGVPVDQNACKGAALSIAWSSS
jgi:hypothetical protein